MRTHFSKDANTIGERFCDRRVEEPIHADGMRVRGRVGTQKGLRHAQRKKTLNCWDDEKPKSPPSVQPPVPRCQNHSPPTCSSPDLFTALLNRETLEPGPSEGHPCCPKVEQHCQNEVPPRQRSLTALHFHCPENNHLQLVNWNFVSNFPCSCTARTTPQYASGGWFADLHAEHGEETSVQSIFIVEITGGMRGACGSGCTEMSLSEPCGIQEIDLHGKMMPLERKEKVFVKRGLDAQLKQRTQKDKQNAPKNISESSEFVEIFHKC